MKIAVIVGSTREFRRSELLIKWVSRELKSRPGVSVELLDLRDYEMPFFDEQISPKANPDRHPDKTVKPWLKKLEEADGFVIITPEYNHAIPAVLKNAIDYVDWQLQHKPTAVVSHGSSGGARATSDLKIIISEARGFVISTNVAITKRVAELFDEKGNIYPQFEDMGWQDRLTASVDELLWYTEALSAARHKK